MNLAQSLIRRRAGVPDEPVRSAPTIPFDQWVSYFGFQGLDYPYITNGSGSRLGHDREEVDATFLGYVEGCYRRNGVVFACIAAKMLIFSEARFRFQQLRDGRPGDLFGTAALDILETPWPSATTGDLLSRMIVDADLAGNAFFSRSPPARPGGSARLRRLRPDWTTIIAGSYTGDQGDGERLGYIYQPGGPGSGNDPVVLLPEEVAHFAPFPDPAAQFRGMSWLTPVLREIMGDGAATNHKLQFFEQGATPNLVVTLGDTNLSPQAFNEWVGKMEASHAGTVNAYKTLYLAAGADAKVVGSDLRQVDFKAVQGSGETRIAAAARVPPIIVGLSEGLQGSSLNTGNYGAAKRAFADGTIRPLWRNAAGSIAHLVGVPPGARLWYDDRDIPFLQEDRKDAAEIQNLKAQTIRSLTDAGYDPDTVIDAIEAEDFRRLRGAHAGLFSVQLQPPNTNGGTPVVPAQLNGAG